MRLLTDKIKEPARSAIRFTIVGVSGTGIQYGWYYLLLFTPLPVGVSFTLAFILEMISNYILTSYYTFASKPSWKNAGGFLVGRGVNYLVQMAFLWLSLHLLGMSEKVGGIVAIVLAGVVNYFVTRLFFKEKKK